MPGDRGAEANKDSVVKKSGHHDLGQVGQGEPSGRIWTGLSSQSQRFWSTDRSATGSGVPPPAATWGSPKAPEVVAAAPFIRLSRTGREWS
jgi:hypothetical protein